MPPDCGSRGLDTESSMDRYAVYHRDCDLGEGEIEKEADGSSPFQPETAHHKVLSITVGENMLYQSTCTELMNSLYFCR